MTKHPWLRPVLTGAFYVLLVVFLVIYLLNIDYSTFQDIALDPWYLVAATGAGLMFRYWQTFIWITVLRGLGARDVRMTPDLSQVYAKSWLGRYIPGTAPWILGKIYFAAQHGVSKAKLAVGSLLEAAIQIIVLLLTSAAMLLFDPRLDVLGAWFPLTAVAVIVAGVVFLLPPVFNRAVGLAFRILRRPALRADNRASGRVILTTVVLYVVGAYLSGLSLFFMALAVDPGLGWSDALFIIAAGNLAGAVSMLAVFAPGGLGVREGIQLTLLGLIAPGALALAIVVLTRLWSVVCDLLFFGVTSVTMLISRRRRRRAAASPPAAIDGDADIRATAPSEPPNRTARRPRA